MVTTHVDFIDIAGLQPSPVQVYTQDRYVSLSPGCFT